MSRAATVKILGAVWLTLALAGGCKKQQSDADAIRSGITSHLASLGSLNLTAMDIDVTNVSIQGTQAHAQVSFRPKTGAPQGATMQVGYQLEKRDGQWVVTKTEASGGAIEHPAPGTNPHLPQNSDKTQVPFPDLRRLTGSPSSGAKAALPPGHPPVAPTTDANAETPSTPH